MAGETYEIDTKELTDLMMLRQHEAIVEIKKYGDVFEICRRLKTSAQSGK